VTYSHVKFWNEKTKKNIAYQAIKKAIISGQLESAKIYSIKELANIFNVSVTPGREALVILASEGLIEPIPRIGYQVKSISVHTHSKNWLSGQIHLSS